MLPLNLPGTGILTQERKLRLFTELPYRFLLCKALEPIGNNSFISQGGGGGYSGIAQNRLLHVAS